MTEPFSVAGPAPWPASRPPPPRVCTITTVTPPKHTRQRPTTQLHRRTAVTVSSAPLRAHLHTSPHDGETAFRQLANPPSGLRNDNGVWGEYWWMGFHVKVGKGRTPAHNRADKQQRVRDDRTHAALVLDGDGRLGWCQIGSPNELPETNTLITEPLTGGRLQSHGRTF